MQFTRILILVWLAIILISCGEENSDTNKLTPRKDNWQIFGRVSDQNFAGGDVVALGLDGIRYQGRIGSDSRFGIQLPSNASYAFYLVGPQQSADQLPEKALLNFEESADVGMRQTLRLPEILFNHQINLGEVDIKDGMAFPTINPALLLDNDSDGDNDFADVDDQNDGLPDHAQNKAFEQIDVCHASSSTKKINLSVPLADLMFHLDRGDSVGKCEEQNF